jgi:alpha-amylase
MQKTHNVKAFEGVSGSILEFYRALYLSRSQYPILAEGRFNLISKSDDQSLIFTRQKDGVDSIVFINLSNSPQKLTAKVPSQVYVSALDLGGPSQLLATEGLISLTIPAKSTAAYVSR